VELYAAILKPYAINNAVLILTNAVVRPFAVAKDVYETSISVSKAAGINLLSFPGRCNI
jgi:hypothetical protein